MASCKCSKEAFFSFKKPGFEHLDTIEKIAQHLNVTIETLEIMNEPQKLKNLGKGDKIRYPNPLHCDDQKSGIDITHINHEIINPLTDANCSDKFKFKANGETEIIGVSEGVKKNVEKTVLNLNADSLCQERKKIYQIAQGLAQQILNERKGFQEIINAIASIDRANVQTHQRREYCFVTSYVLRTTLLRKL